MRLEDLGAERGTHCVQSAGRANKNRATSTVDIASSTTRPRKNTPGAGRSTSTAASKSTTAIAHSAPITLDTTTPFNTVRSGGDKRYTPRHVSSTSVTVARPSTHSDTCHTVASGNAKNV